MQSAVNNAPLVCCVGVQHFTTVPMSRLYSVGVASTVNRKESVKTPLDAHRLSEVFYFYEVALLELEHVPAGLDVKPPTVIAANV